MSFVITTETTLGLLVCICIRLLQSGPCSTGLRRRKVPLRTYPLLKVGGHMDAEKPLPSPPEEVWHLLTDVSTVYGRGEKRWL